MKTKFSFLDPGAVIGVVVALIVLSVGIFAFFVTLGQLSTQNSGASWNAGTSYAINNTTVTGSQVFNIIGVVIIIGAIMSIVGLVYNYIR